ncbi:MAG: MFS transporter [Rickettsiales bacterium]|nr:MAG: MFS transporter [Rickettsiales bacterium]
MIKNLPFLLVISLLTGCLEVDISVPSFPDISDYFDISDALTQMTIAINFLGFCISSIVYGPLSDSFGRRRVMMVGNFIMLIGAVGCVVATSIEFLLFARFIQGIGASTSAVVVFAMIADTYSADKSAKIIGTMNSLITVFMSLAPIVGGLINESIGWRGNFFTIAMLSIVSWIMLYFWLPETKKHFTPFSRKKILQDYKTLFFDRSFTYASLVPTLTFAGYISFIACASFLYMEAYDLPIMHYALHQGAIIAVFSVVSLYSGDVSKFLGERNCVIYGMFLLTAGSSFMLMVALLSNKSPYLTTLSMMIYGVGSAISYPVVFARSLEIFPDISGSASSVIMAIRSLMCAAFIALSSYLYAGKLVSVALVILLAATIAAFLSSRLLKLISFDTNT